MPAQSAIQFIEVVRKSRLIDDDCLNQVLGSEAEFLDSEEAAERLVSKGLLTRFQLKQLLSGRWRGLVVGPYKILDQIGRGGMGIVYLAEHTKLLRQVALKVLPKDKTNDKLALDRFYREARAVAALDHENIVKAHDINEFDGLHYFVMEYVQGANLQIHLDQKGPVPWKTAVKFIEQACWGLQHAHKKGLVHRDIKPGNLLVDRKGTLKILDLGLARCFANEKDNLTGNLAEGAEITGSINYIAPEQAMGSPSIDIRTDIYSLGATFFALIAGRPPFEGSPAQKLMQHQMKQPPLLHEIRPEVPEELSAVVCRMMAKRPEDRYATPAEVVAALEPWVGTAVAVKKADRTDSFKADGRKTNPLPPVPLTSEDVVPTDTEEDTYTAAREKTRVNVVRIEVPDMELEHRRLRRAKKRQAERRQRIMWGTALTLSITPFVGFAIFTMVSYFSGDKSSAQAAAPSVQQSTTPPPMPGNGASLTAPPGNPQPPTPGSATSLVTGPPGNTPLPPQQQASVSQPSGNWGKLPKEGSVLPEFRGEDLNGDPVATSHYNGKVLLLAFWSFHSQPCKELIPYARTLVLRMHGKPFVLLGVNTDLDQAMVAQQIVAQEINWRSLKDRGPDGKFISRQWEVRLWPTLLLVDHRGVIRLRYMGRPNEATLDAQIQALLQEAELAQPR